MAAGKAEVDAPTRDPDVAADLEQLGANRRHQSLGQLGSLQADSTHVFDQHVRRRRRQQQALLIRQELAATRAVGEQARLLLLDAVLRVVCYARRPS
jgi:hypothetical protein